MTKLNCGVETCVHNKSNYCCISAIKVGGNHTTNVTETCCYSFAENEGTFTSGSEFPNPELSISCDAENCIYNSHLNCTAEHINVAGHSAHNNKDTECATFQCE